jgi:Tol biopolymer transport system component
VCIKEVVVKEEVLPLNDTPWKILKEETYITVMNADGTEEEDLWKIPNTAGMGVAYSPSGNLVAYNGDGGLYVMNKDGGDKKHIKGIWINDWSPDEKQVVWAGGGIWVANIDGSGKRKIAEGSNPSWYWGEKVLIRGVYTIDIKTGRKEKITEVGAIPRWFPGGKKILYVNRDNKLWIVDADGKNAKKIGEIGITNCSPDGKKILWLDGGICVANLDGSNKKVIKKHSTTKIDYRY